jgi:putative FmdB family regulatory protein
MPTYDYECSVCQGRFELFTGVHDSAARVCPKCGKKKAKRLIGAGAGFIFKGSGFYVTDSKAAPPAESKPAATPDTPTKTKSPDPASGKPRKKAE